jgi:hypothetical protein
VTSTADARWYGVTAPDDTPGPAASTSIRRRSYARPSYARLALVAAAGAVTTVAVLFGALPPPLVGLLVAGGFILLLPRLPWETGVFLAGAAVPFVIFFAVWAQGWGCASEVDGRVVEHECGELSSGR